MSRQAVEASPPAGLYPSLHPSSSPLCPSPARFYPDKLKRCMVGARQGEGVSLRREALQQQKGPALMSTIPLLKTRGKNYTGLGAADKQAAGTGREISFFYYLVLLQVTTLSVSA